MRSAQSTVGCIPIAIETPWPNPQSQSFSRGYGSNLPTSLIYIVLSTRGYTPWRPDAVMSTTWGANKSRCWIFKGRPERTRLQKDLGALPVASPYRRAIRFQGRAARLTRKENSPEGPGRRLQLRLCRHSISTSRCGNVNPLPFRPKRSPKKSQSGATRLGLRID